MKNIFKAAIVAIIALSTVSCEKQTIECWKCETTGTHLPQPVKAELCTDDLRDVLRYKDAQSAIDDSAETLCFTK